MSFLGQDEQIREYQFRFRYLYIALFIGFFILFARLWYLQIINGDMLREFAEANRIKRVKIASPRGMIFDRNRTLLVDNRPAFDLEITPQELYADKNWKGILSRLSKMVAIEPEEIEKTLLAAKGQPAFLPVRVKQDLTPEQLALVEAHRLDLPGVNSQMEIKRTYLYKDLAAHLMGYIGEVAPAELPRLNSAIQKGGIPYKMGDETGKYGLESRWEAILRGIDGEEYLEVDAYGRRKRDVRGITSSLTAKPGTPGRNLILTLDQDLQLAAKEAIEKIYKDKKIGGVIAIDPRNGEILASLSAPSFDPTLFSRGVSSKLWNSLLNNEYKPLMDKTIQDHYSPGSTFKAVTAIAGLEEGAIDENTTVVCNGSHRLGNRVYHCHKRGGHGTVNVHDALKVSCDVFFYRLGQRLGINTIAKYAKMLGLGMRSGVNLAHEEPGLIPTEEWKMQRYNQEWIAGETLSCAIGQSYMLTTPIQLANLYSAIGNGGHLWKPFIVKYVESPDGQIVKEFQPELIKKADISEKTLQIVRGGLFGVVNEPHGTTYAFRVPGFDIAGKTGTSQVIKLAQDRKPQKCEAMPFDLRDNALFAAWAPLKNPRIAVAVIAEHGCHGNTSAAPIALAVIKKYLQKYMPEEYGEEVIKARLKKNTLMKTATTTIPATPHNAEDDE